MPGLQAYIAFNIETYACIHAHTHPRGSPERQGHPEEESAASIFPTEHAQKQGYINERKQLWAPEAQEHILALCQELKPKMAELPKWELR